MTLIESNSHLPIIESLRTQGWTAKQSSWNHATDGTIYAWDLRSPRGTDVFFTDPFTEDSVIHAESLRYAIKLHGEEVRAQIDQVFTNLMNDLAAIYRVQLIAPGKGVEIPEDLVIKDIPIKLTRKGN